jgi:AAA15 family ATPase/GTPase
MKIIRIKIKNFRSLRDVLIDNIGNLTIIIGENSSGKSNLLEALELFFTQFDPAPQRTVGAVNDYVWFDRNPQNAIEFALNIQVTGHELKELLPEQLHKIIADQNKVESNEIEITRSLTGTATAASWSTKLLSINGTILVSDGKLVYKDDGFTNIPIQPPVKSPASTQPPVKLPPSAVVVQTSAPSVSPTDVLGGLLQKFSRNFMGKYRIISAARNVTGSPTRLGDRVAFVSQTTMGDLTTYGQSMERDHQKKWTDVEEKVTGAARNVRDLRFLAGQITVGEKGSDIRYPISLVGGGNQEILSLAHELTRDKGAIYGLEEPEQHLHPELARHFFDVLKEISKDSQVFVTTHSPIFVDQVELENTWLARKVNNETNLTKVKDTADLREVLYEIGVKPSDIFFANAILFVEGPTERAVLPILAKKLGIDLREIGLSIIPIHGSGSGKYHLQVWIEASKAANIPYFMLLDKDAKGEADRLVQKDLLKRDYNLFILHLGSIEDYYPIPKVTAALKSEFNVDLKPEEVGLLKSPTAKSIATLLTNKKVDTRGWKISVGRNVATAMSSSEIPNEVRSFLERLNSEVKLQ